jgi:hypothetical protein
MNSSTLSTARVIEIGNVTTGHIVSSVQCTPREHRLND